MSESRQRDDEAPQLTSADAAFVRALAAHYRAPEPTPAQRAAFRAAIDERLRRRPERAWPTWAAGLAAASLAFTALWWTSPPDAPPATGPSRTTAVSAEEALIVLAMPATDDDASLPVEYEAIAELFLDEG